MGLPEGVWPSERMSPEGVRRRPELMPPERTPPERTPPERTPPGQPVPENAMGPNPPEARI